MIVGLWLLLALAQPATAQNFTNTPPRLSIERQVEGLGLRVIAENGMLNELSCGTSFDAWTNNSTHITDETNDVYWLDGQGTKFFQWVADDQMRFPAWHGFVEKKVTFNFQPPRREGAFRLDTYTNGTLWDHLEGNVNDWADPATGTVWLVDAGETPADGYSYEGFVFDFTWTPPEPDAAAYSQVLKKRQRRRNTVAGVTVTNGLVVQQRGTLGSALQEVIDGTQRAVFSNSIDFIFQTDLNGTGLSESDAPSNLLAPEDWSKLRFRILTNHTLTHLHYYGDGSPSHLGSRDRPGERITTAALASSPRLQTNLLTYVGLDGFVSGDGDLLKYLLGYKRVMSTEFGREGLFRCFGWGWTHGKSNFTNSLHFEFIRAFYMNLGELNPSSYPRTSVWRFREAYERARRLPNGEENVESHYFYPVGCFNCYFPL